MGEEHKERFRRLDDLTIEAMVYCLDRNCWIGI